MLIIAANPKIGERATSEVVRLYEDQGHKAKGVLVSVRNAKSEEDFV